MERLYSLAEFRDATGISRSAIFRLFKRGDGPETVRIGRRRMITASAYAEWLEKRRQDQRIPHTDQRAAPAVQREQAAA